MIQAMEQQIINGIKGEFLKNTELRREADIDKISDSLRVICSSRSSFYSLMHNYEKKESQECKNAIRDKISEVYIWIVGDTIHEIIDSFENPVTINNVQKEKYIFEVPYIKSRVNILSQSIINLTLEKLISFHIKKEKSSKLEEYIIIDIETCDFDLESGIHEVGLVVVEQGEIVYKKHFGIVEDESLLDDGMGYGYKDCSNDIDIINEFKEIINKYKYPLVAHNGSFDRRFLVHYGWIDEDYLFYDSMRAIRSKRPYLFSYRLEYLIDYYNIDKHIKHLALEDVEMLYEILKIVQPDTWIPIGVKKSIKTNKNLKKISVIDKEYEVVNDIFKDKLIVFTGSGPFARRYLMQLAKKCSANVSNSVTKKTNLLIVGEKPGKSKMDKAKELGIEIMYMNDFVELVSGIELDIDNIDKKKESTPIKTDVYSEFIKNNYKDKVISLIPMKLSLANKVYEILQNGGAKPLLTLRKDETDLLVYQSYGEDYATVNRAKKAGIPTISLGKFNRLMLND